MLPISMETNNASYDSNCIELSPDTHTDGRHYVVSRDKSGSYAVYTLDGDTWDELPINGPGTSYVFDGDLKDYGAEVVDVDPRDIETYDLATEAEQIKTDIHNASEGELRRVSDALHARLMESDPVEAVIVGEEPGWNNADERPRAEIYHIEGHKVLKFENAEYSQLHVIDDGDDYEMLFEAIYSDASLANEFEREDFAAAQRASEATVRPNQEPREVDPDDYTFKIETVGMIGDAVARDFADELENADYKPRETYLSEQEHRVWVLTRVRGRSYETTANTMDVGVETVKTYLSRISKKKAKAQATLELLN